MPRSVSLGNGNILVCLDKFAQVKDFYFPFVGLENQIGRYTHRMGVFVEGEMHWFDNGQWQIITDCKNQSMLATTVARNDGIGIEVTLVDAVSHEDDIFIRSVKVKNLRESKREVKFFFYHQFELYGAYGGDTAYYDPRGNVIVHYKGKRVFLINLLNENKGFDDFAVGAFGIENKEGTFRDIEDDGFLTKNAIEHGVVDSAIASSFHLSGNGTEEFFYWIAVAETVENAHKLNAKILSGPSDILNSTEDFWRAWVNKSRYNFWKLSEDVIANFKKSLLLIRSHVDNRGGIIASGDSGMLQYGKDTYGYVWPRDGSLTTLVLDRTGDTDLSRHFFKFCNKVIDANGYLAHKYRPDGSLGSSWHSLLMDGKIILPIQEDETALVLCALWEHYLLAKDIEFIAEIYDSFIKKSADFMVSYRDKKFGLPRESYDLWEEKYGISTFTVASVYAGLISASRFAELLGKKEESFNYRSVAQEVKNALLDNLYDKDSGLFYKLVNLKDDKFITDKTVDISTAYGLFKFGILDIDDSRLSRFMEIVEEKLFQEEPVFGFSRYEGDFYYKDKGQDRPNIWFIATCWFLKYKIAKSKDEKEITEIIPLIEKVSSYATVAGVMSEQLNPYTGEQISVAPLTWSQAEFVGTILDFLKKVEDLGICKTCPEGGGSLVDFQ